MAADVIVISSSSSSSYSPLFPKGQKRGPLWHKMMKARKKIQKSRSNAAVIKGHRGCAGKGCTVCLESSNGTCWVRVSRLGEGGFGTVFLAKRRSLSLVNHREYNNNLPNMFAVKSATMENSMSLKFEKEVLCKLTASPHVVRCYGDEITETIVGEKIYNLLLEYCSGLSLHHQINVCGRGGLPESNVKLYTRDIVRGLEYIHSSGYVHCDIKPCNILLVPAGTQDRSGGFVAKIADFGLAKSLLEEQKGDDNLRGTYLYMSPELVRDKKLERPVDIWALGCTVLEMMSGKPAWKRSDRNDLLQIIGYSDKLPRMPSNIPENCKDFLGKCLDRNATRRWSAKKLLEHPFIAGDP